MNREKVTQQITKWTEQLKTNTALFSDNFGTLSSDQLNWKPNDATWSIAQVVDHIVLINESYQPIIESAQKGTLSLPFLSKFDFVNKMQGKMIYNAVLPDRKKKIKTFPIWEPSESNIGSNIIERFVKSQNKIEKLIASCSDLLEQDTVICSPANTKITYTLKMAFYIVIAHEERHFYQAEEI